MYICICNGIRESDLRAAVNSGTRNTRELFRLMGAKPKCGTCLRHAQAIIRNQELQKFSNTNEHVQVSSDSPSG